MIYAGFNEGLTIEWGEEEEEEEEEEDQDTAGMLVYQRPVLYLY
jgi:hypothetical protein